MRSFFLSIIFALLWSYGLLYADAGGKITCDSSPCQNGGFCLDNEDGYSCICESPFSGDDCETDPCSSNPCMNGGKCMISGESFTCECVEPFSGTNCEDSHDLCYPNNPCQNEGVCIKDGDVFKCMCKAPYFGKTCEQSKNPCSSNPCRNGGKCVISGESFTCECVEPFSGSYCEDSHDLCYPNNPCKNQGECIKDGDDFKCMCKAPYFGRACEQSKNTCSLNDKCQNGGSCVYEDGRNYCQCKNGTSGVHCEIVDECEKNSLKCGIGSDVQCIYNTSKEIAECKCNNASKAFDSFKKKCRAPCKTSNDCPEYIYCSRYRDNNLKFCKCPFGMGGDRCYEKVDECKAMGYDCGSNPNVTCLENVTGDAVCYCQDWSDGFNYEAKDCVECNCEGRNLGCYFLPGGAKMCYCAKEHYQKGEKCVACDCGYGSNGCESENGTKKCNCWGTYQQNGDKCEDCDCGKNSNGCSFENGLKTCSCKSGYIQSNGTCRKICKEWSFYEVCKNGAKCKNSVCQCLSGTQGDICEIIDECADYWDVRMKCGYSSSVECVFNQTSLTSFCRCKEKDLLFDNYDKKCKACDCGSHGYCSFIRGDKTCKCEEGYSLNPGGWYSNSECAPCDCGVHSTECTFEYRDSKVCKCDAGYAERKGECTECSCGPYGRCSFDEDGEKVCSCDYGYADNNGFCTKCTCGDYGDCEWNKFGEEICHCVEGYGIKDGKCEPCNCGDYGECEWNEFGEKICSCREGFAMKDGKCEICSCYWDVRYESRIINCTFRMNGDQKCLCPEGYEERREGICSDIDECKDMSKCPRTTDCNNVPGGYTCTCKKGYRPFNERHDTKLYDCLDINECLEQNECPYRDTSECVNTAGSYYCKCKSGYYSKYFSSHSIEIEGCQKDQTGWRIGYILLLVVFGIVSFGLIIAIYKRRSSS